jgi:hypothetical protein
MHSSNTAAALLATHRTYTMQSPAALVSPGILGGVTVTPGTIEEVTPGTIGEVTVTPGTIGDVTVTPVTIG